MAIEDYSGIDEGSEAGSQSSEISEKYKAQAKKAAAGIKRTKKDEKKSQKYDLMLSKFLSELIRKKKYDDVLEKLFVCLDAGHGTNFLLGVMSLVYIPISHELRKTLGKEAVSFHYNIPQEPVHYTNSTLPKIVQDRINSWVEDMKDIMMFQSSIIVTNRTLGLILYDDAIRIFIRDVFDFFFREISIHISSHTLDGYSDFILQELEKTTKQKMTQVLSENSDASDLI